MANRFWNLQNASPNWNATAPTNWGSASNTADDASVPGLNDDVFFDGVGGGANNSTLSAAITINSLDTTGYANTLTHNASVTLTVDGNGVVYKLSSGMTYTKGSVSSSATTFTGTSGTTLITVNGKTLGTTTFNGVGGTWQLQDTFITSGSLTVTNGSFDTNNVTCTFGALSSSNSNVRIISLGSSTISLTTATTAWTFATATNLTFNAGTSTIKFTQNSSSDTTASWGGKTFNNVWINTLGTGILRNAGSGTFNDYKIDAGRTVRCDNGITLTVTSLTATGTVGNVITFQSVVSPNTWNISQSSGTVSCDYLSLRDSAAAGGATFYAGANSTDVSGNSGWTFTAPPAGGAASMTGFSSMTGVSSITI